MFRYMCVYFALSNVMYSFQMFAFAPSEMRNNDENVKQT